MRTQLLLTFDTSVSLGLALVARENLSGARYVPLVEAPIERGTARAPHVRQLHAVANSVAYGVEVRARMPFRPLEWEQKTKALGA